MATSGALACISLLGFGNALAQSTENREPTSRTAFDGSKSGAWLFPVETLNHALPLWLRFGGEYRSRFESEDGIRFTTTNNTYLMSSFRLNETIQPVKWLIFF